MRREIKAIVGKKIGYASTNKLDEQERARNGGNGPRVRPSGR